ncbi:MAG: hypothetical protein RLZZ164_394 [Actinomycetota bacterium]|jgi:phospholipase/carboxylesterase
MRHPIRHAIVHNLDERKADQNSDAQPIILLLHGYGANEKDLIDIVPFLKLTHAWVSLRGGLATQHGGFAWFPLAAPGIPNVDDVVDATEDIWHWIDENLSADSPLIVIGFSQGGLMASQLLRTRPSRILDTVILSGFVLQGSQPADAELMQSKPRVFYARGLQDGVISPVAVERTYDWLRHHSRASVPTYDGLGHSIDNRVLRDVEAHLSAR